MSAESTPRAWTLDGRSIRARLATHEWVLAALGSLSALAYGAFFIVMHLRSQMWAPGQVLEPLDGYWRWFYRTIFSQEYVEAARRSAAADAHPFLMLGSLTLISALYLVLLGWLKRLDAPYQPRLRVLLGLAFLSAIPLLALPNLLSGDVYSYIAFGRMAVIHGGNPFIDPPSAFPSDPFYRWVNWKQVASVYGPGWIYPSMLLTAFVESIRSHAIAYVLAYKVLSLGLHLANGALIWSILSRSRPEQRVWGTALYLLCPLALIEFAGNAHNDVLMITFLLLGVWLHLRGSWLLTIAAWTVAVLTKWIALPLLPLYGLCLLWQSRSWRQRLTRTALGLAVFAGLATLLYRPYWEGWKTLEILVDAPPQKRLINSLGDVASKDLQRAMWRLGYWPNPALADPLTLFILPGGAATARGDSATATSQFVTQQRADFAADRARFRVMQSEADRNGERIDAAIRLIALSLLGVACLVAAAVTRSFNTVLLAGAWIFFVYCTVGAVWFWPWYVTWFVALAALLDWRVTGRTAVMLALLAPLIYVFFPSLPDPVWWQRYRAVLAFGPPLLFAAWHGVRVARESWRKWRGRRLSHPATRSP